ncbi:beta-glucosidase [Thermocatellispora tengchongensis]|uniref:Beta-glucosidase n=1 Tax=Thermocatellispora tengchongensis TaxID=1073253 RepID=A0A840PEP9_9ACTN|nr:glycoside hydrolase family 3 C-terminal domain-containing protein [Thermocatellispora tengchongensis]MBB5135627.1 beta-glucosidase [Thermocatellispora tengchongensis]
MTLKEKVALLTGADAWTLTPVPSAGLGALALSDGPVGPRGTSYGGDTTPSLLFPSPTSLAATWDEETARETGRLMGARAREMGVHVLLAPTVNLHRSPLGGRHFECYSEDPLLSARMAAGFVEGVQSAGVAATVKHFVGNDSETERMTYDARIGEAALREVYLPPFEAAVREAGAWVVMAAYNRVNGETMTENHRLLTGVLKDEWGFDGVVVSDWMAARSTEATALAGLDLVMPGPDGPWGDALVAAVEDGRVPAEVVDDKVLRVLRLAARTGALEGAPAPPAPAVPRDVRDRLRELAVRGSVLLRNDGLLPLRAEGLRRVALIGPNAVRLAAQGGGSAHVTPERVVTPLEGLRRMLGDDVQITVHAGVFPHAKLPPLPGDLAADPETSQAGVRLEYRAADGSVLSAEHRDPAPWWFPIVLADEVRELVVRARLTLTASGVHRLSVLGTGRHTLRVPGQDDQAHEQLQDGDDIAALLLNPPSHTFTFQAPAGPVDIEVRIEPQRNLPYPVTLAGLGYEPPRGTDEEELAAAEAAARTADVAIVLVGSDADTETENLDRTTLALRGRQDELVRRVCAANPRTVVVVNAGAPWLMPWAERPGALLWAWFPGQEGGDAIADVLFGAEPGGRLPTTFPATEGDVPVLSTRPVDGVLDYAEGDRIGYRAYRAEGVLFPFGHGLSYTTWEYVRAISSGDAVEVTVRNAGDRPGREVVQAYLESSGSLRLAGFAAVEAGPGQSVTARIEIAPRALSRWTGAGWARAEGPHTLRIGRSTSDLPLTCTLA